MISPATVVGNGADTVPITVTVNFNNSQGGQQSIVIQATDKLGATSTKAILVRVSDPIKWRLNVTVSNNNGGFQNLTFGKGARATDGLDSNFCEYALPPIPPADVFDSRWVINDKSGTVGSLRDFRDSTLPTPSIYQGIVQAGGNGNQTNYPVFISWNLKNVPNPKSILTPGGDGLLWLRDRFGGSLFNINMATGKGYVGAQVQLLTNVGGDPNAVSLQISNTQVTGFFILSDPLSSVEELPGGLTPAAYVLEQNYPNPFTPMTNIRFALPAEQNTKLEVIDVMGRVIATLVNDKVQSGYYNVTWNGKDDFGNVVGAGVYFYRLSAGGHFEMKQMTLLK